MESAPLNNAHALARDAHQASPKSSQATAEKHRAAAGGYLKAAEGVEDSEALRVLKLLEQHHQRIAQIITSASDRSAPRSSSAISTTNSPIPEPPTSSNAFAANESSSANVNRVDGKSQRLTSATVPRRPARDLTSSIASNLATARGIPHGPPRKTNRQLSPPHETNEGPSNVQVVSSATDRSRKRSDARDTQLSLSQTTARNNISGQVPHQLSTRDTPVEETRSPIKPNEDAFHKFYSTLTFEGLLSKLSAPLAFAGLPLVPEEQHDMKTEALPANPKALPRSVSSTSPDISKIYSKSALRAIKDERGTLGVQESFFVVPTGGGTVSYAGVASRAEGQARHNLEMPVGDSVNKPSTRAPDAQGVSSWVASTGARKVSKPGLSNKTQEELEIENDSLKQLTDNLSRRLYDWEKSAQSQSMALQQSIRNLQPPSRTSSNAVEDKGNEHAERMKDLEEQITTAQKELERYGRENEKLRTVVLRYRERWEKLKEGARRREGVSDPLSMAK